MATAITVVREGPLNVSGLSSTQEKILTNIFKIENPSYEQAVRTNPKAKYALSKWIKYVHKNKDGSFQFPAGSLRIIESVIGTDYTLLDKRVSMPVDVVANLQLRDYQKFVPEKIAGRSGGTVILGTGWGKTYGMMGVINKLQERTLIIVPTLDILEQFVVAVKDVFGFEPGLIQGKSMPKGEDIVVATIQTLSNRSIPPRHFGLVMVDECHQFITKKRIDVIQALAPIHLYGWTATGRRSDGQDAAINWLFGPTIIEEEVPRDRPTVWRVKSPCKIWVREYAEMVDEQIQDPGRNALITHIVKSQLREGRKVLVLTKRVAHAQSLCESLNDPKARHLRSDTEQELRGQIMNDLKDPDADFSALFATFNLLSTGVDIPSLDTLVIAGDLKSDVLVEQSAGRILRLLDGKKDTRIIDIVDASNPVFSKQAKVHKELYERKGWVAVDKSIDVF